MNTTSAQPSVTFRLLVATGSPGISAMMFEKNTKVAAVPMMGKYFLARSASMTLLARS